MVNSIILDVNGNPLTKNYRDIVSHSQQTLSSKTAYLYKQFAEHPSSRLTPARLISILNEAEQGNLTRQAELFTDMEEKDAHIFSEMDKRKRAILTLQYRVIPVKGATPDEVGYASYLTEMLEELENFDDLLIDMLDGIGQGFSNLEIEWQKLGAEWHPAEFHYRPQSWFQLDNADQNKIVLRTEDGAGTELRKFGWICHRHKSRSGYIARSGLMRTLSWPYLYRQFGIQSLAELLEIYGIPIRIGKFAEGTSEKDRKKLLQTVNEIGRYAGGIIPKEMEIEIRDAARGSSSPFMDLTNWSEKAISKAVLGGTLTSQADGKSSTNALGQIHNEVRKDIRDSDARQVAPTIRRDLFYPMIFFNRNPTVDPRRVPKIEFYSEKEEQERENTGKASLNNKKIYLSRSALSLQEKEKTLRNQIDVAVTKKQSSQVMCDYVISLLSPVLPKLADAKTDTQVLEILTSEFPKLDIDNLHQDLSEIALITQMLAQADT